MSAAPRSIPTSGPSRRRHIILIKLSARDAAAISAMTCIPGIRQRKWLLYVKACVDIVTSILFATVIFADHYQLLVELKV